jgi:hypothetical protein
VSAPGRPVPWRIGLEPGSAWIIACLMNLFAAALSIAILSVVEMVENFRGAFKRGQMSDENERCSDSCFSALETFPMYPLTRSYGLNIVFSGARWMRPGE